MSDLAPLSAVPANAPRPEGQRCADCGFFSVKVQRPDPAEHEGKCFGHGLPDLRTYWVEGAMWCPRFRADDA